MSLPSFCTVYKLYKEDRCFGNSLKHTQNEKTLILEHTRMGKLVEYINVEGDKTKAYYILKCTGDNVSWRQLGRYDKNKQRFRVGEFTTTWARFFYDNTSNKWKESNYRYEDEIVLSRL
jgi:hypothetical protein